MGVPTYPQWTPNHCQQQPQVAEHEEDTEEDKVAGHTHESWQIREVEQQVSGKGAVILVVTFTVHKKQNKTSAYTF